MADRLEGTEAQTKEFSPKPGILTLNKQNYY